jgi:hypothetical protein
VAALLALCLQAIAIKGPLGDSDSVRRGLLVCSYILLIVFVAFNLRRPGIALIGLGISLNFGAIVANGGLMPITPEAVLRTGDLPIDAVVGEWLPGSKDVLLERDEVRLWFLGDRLTWDTISSVLRAFSIGDVVIFAGLLVTLGDFFVPRLRPAGAVEDTAADPAG